MGTFGGHILPGSFFILFAIWWTISLFVKYFRVLSQRGPARRYRDILLFYKFPVPPDSDYVSMVMALSVEALLFHFHLHGRSDMDVHVHTLLLYTVVASAAVLIVEINHRDNVSVVFLRAFFTFLQGTWFYQIGFILYNPISDALPWDQNNHQQIMLVTAIFAWHMAAITVFMGLIGFFVWLKYRLLFKQSELYYNATRKDICVEIFHSSKDSNQKADDKKPCLVEEEDEL
ncbi:transmembrane protein 45B-like [Tachypleus tridentatus]|uniref:transmembrane protein 45B-like n=1 Tax=Tachypleus tridentatus TaxID=6853 RepID=UPI003FD6315A